MIIFVDIDETICTKYKNLDYSTADPIKENIDKINQLYSEGHTIVYWTARGTRTGHNWFHLTKLQLDQWGARYNELRMGKPVYDLFICDKSIKIEEI
jgi:hydroxymethylpyrimidine pyrophosphatase-like HAD family hydrolase